VKDFQILNILVDSSLVSVYIYQGSEGKVVFVNNYFADILDIKRVSW